MIATLAFYVFAAILLASAAMVVSARNPVHSVLFLILAFFNASALFVLAGAEFLALILLIVYVGAVAVLFLFVVMMLDINFSALREGFQRYAPVGATIGVVLLVELAIVLGGWKFAPDHAALRLAPRNIDVNNTAQLGRLIYTQYVLLFQAAGLILLVSMIGAIVLTLRDRPSRGQRVSRRQDISRQVGRRPVDTLVMMDVASRTGVAQLGILRPLPDRPALPAPTLEQADPDPHGPAHGPMGGHTQ